MFGMYDWHFLKKDIWQGTRFNGVGYCKISVPLSFLHSFCISSEHKENFNIMSFFVLPDLKENAT